MPDLTTPSTGGHLLVRALTDHGVDTVFGIPGTHNLAVYAAMAALGVRHVSPRHEQGAGYAADGYARATGRPGVVVTTTGPAILNALAAAAQAWSDSVPVLLVSPAMPTGHPGRGNGLLHEVRNQSLAMEAVLGESIRVGSVEEIPLAVQQAFSLMGRGRPRPVHLEVPLDLLDATAVAAPVAPVRQPALAPDPQVLTDAAAALATADRVVIVAGGGAAGAGGADGPLARLATRLDAAVLTTANGKGVVPEDHPSSVGAGLQHRAAVDLCGSADVVLAVGTELAPSDWWSGLPDLGPRTVRIDVDATSIATNAAPRWPVVADAALAVTALLDAVPVRSPGAPAGTWVEEWRDRFRADARAEGAPWLELVDGVASVLPRDAVVAVDNAMAGYYGFLSNLPLHRPRSFLYPTGGGTLGYALPAGVGAKVAEPSTPVVVVEGDGGLMFSLAELATAAQLGLALPVLVVDNGGYGEIRNEMADRQDPVHGVGLGGPDFVALARALGCHGVRADTGAEVAVAVRDALVADRPTLVHVLERSRAADGLR